MYLSPIIGETEGAILLKGEQRGSLACKYNEYFVCLLVVPSFL